MTRPELTEELRSSLRQARMVASTFIAASLLVPLLIIWFQPVFGRARLSLGPAAMFSAILVAVLLSLGLALRQLIDRRSQHAADDESYRALRLLAVVVPSAFAEVAAVYVAFAWVQSRREDAFLVLLVPVFLVLAIAWPRPAVEQAAAREHERAG